MHQIWNQGGVSNQHAGIKCRRNFKTYRLPRQDGTGQSSRVPVWKPDKYIEGVCSQHTHTAHRMFHTRKAESHLKPCSTVPILLLYRHGKKKSKLLARKAILFKLDRTFLNTVKSFYYSAIREQFPWDSCPWVQQQSFFLAQNPVNYLLLKKRYSLL